MTVISIENKTISNNQSSQQLSGHISSNDIYFSVKLSNKPPAPIVEFEIPYLGAEDVIDEVITLLAKLETDRQDTKKNLQKEKERVNTLSSKIDNLSEQRLHTLPEAVQSGKNTICNQINDQLLILMWK